MTPCDLGAGGPCRGAAWIHGGRPREAAWYHVVSFCGFDWKYHVSLSEKNTQSFSSQVATLWAAGIGLFSAASNEVKLPGNQIGGRKKSISWFRGMRSNITSYSVVVSYCHGSVLFCLLFLACSVLVRNPSQPPHQEFSLSMVLLMAKSSAASHCGSNLDLVAIGLPAALGAVLSWFSRALCMSHDFWCWVYGSSTTLDDVLCHIELIWSL